MYRSMENLYKKSNNYPGSRLWHISQFVNSYCQDKAQTNLKGIRLLQNMI